MRVSDNGSPNNLSVTTSVSVSLIDVNENAPPYIFSQLYSTLDTSSLSIVQSSSLRAQLDAAKRQYDKGNIQPAINQLNQFISQVKSYIKAGYLSPTLGQQLVDEANSLIKAM